tara:strand:- start:5608 stop:5733 length:126 start_codon:yes stop_codon:yes gene_type:complete
MQITGIASVREIIFTKKQNPIKAVISVELGKENSQIVDQAK